MQSGVPQGSTLGALLFLAYTIDLKNILTSPFAMYADDVKLYNTSTNNSLLIQEHAAILKWSHDRLLPLNIKKCNVLYIGKHNPKYTYSIGGAHLEKKD
ncbi:hypothetical protein Zmor_018496 [Zophobas morio]|uniref:Reverse transcriptase domain-containing protein n=1 Tax=Zophobas morio TaxID=2755281 RepID=A0AA38IE30_9CUCU|nr:hypothetical protein Zmor_018496 [Zophobas morio]